MLRAACCVRERWALLPGGASFWKWEGRKALKQARAPSISPQHQHQPYPRNNTTRPAAYRPRPTIARQKSRRWLARRKPSARLRSRPSWPSLCAITVPATLPRVFQPLPNPGATAIYRYSFRAHKPTREKPQPVVAACQRPCRIRHLGAAFSAPKLHHYSSSHCENHRTTTHHSSSAPTAPMPPT